MDACQLSRALNSIDAQHNRQNPHIKSLTYVVRSKDNGSVYLPSAAYWHTVDMMLMRYVSETVVLGMLRMKGYFGRVHTGATSGNGAVGTERRRRLSFG